MAANGFTHYIFAVYKLSGYEDTLFLIFWMNPMEKLHLANGSLLKTLYPHRV